MRSESLLTPPPSGDPEALPGDFHRVFYAWRLMWCAPLNVRKYGFFGFLGLFNLEGKSWGDEGRHGDARLRAPVKKIATSTIKRDLTPKL